MTAEFDPTSAPEPHKMSRASSAALTSGQKPSKFAAKSGFVIPKNKLSGSLVPVFRGAQKHGVTGGAVNEESSKHIERITKWGPDLTQDASVKRAKAMALQIRVDQITKQLESEELQIGDSQNLPIAAENSNQSKSGSDMNSKSEMLELEKREAIGEILKLDPSYKPPPGFKPLLKEASIPLPVQEHPPHKFIGLIYGPESDTQKRLEKETGAKIKIHGTRADTGDKGEIKPGTDIQCSYQEMHINISADSFDKVDAAVSIIELLLSSITGNSAAVSTPVSVSGDSTNVPSQSQDAPPSNAVSLPSENQVVLQPAAVTQMHGDHFQYPGPWFSVTPSHTPLGAASGSIVPPYPPGRTPHFPSQTMTPSNMVSTFGAQPVPVPGFRPMFPNHHVSMQAPPPRPILQHSHMNQASPLGHIVPPRNHSVVPVQNFSAPTNASVSFQVTLSQPTPIGYLQTPVPSMPQPMSGISPSPMPNQPLTPLGVSPGQSGGPVGLSNLGPMAPPAVPPTRPVSLGQSASFSPHQSGFSPGPPSSLGSMAPAPTHSSANHLPRPVSFPSPRMSPSLPLPQQSGTPNSSSGVAPYQAHATPLVLTTSNSGNFTFQSQRPNADYGQVASRPNIQVTAEGSIQEPSSGPRPPPFGFSVPDQRLQMFPQTQAPRQVDQTQAHLFNLPFGRRSGSVSIPPRHTAFPYADHPGPRSPVPQMGMQNFNSAPQRPNFPTPGVPSGMHIRQNYPSQRAWQDIPMPLNQKFGNNHSMASGKPAYPADQIYDPFSPTSVAPPQQKGNNGK